MACIFSGCRPEAGGGEIELLRIGAACELEQAARMLAEAFNRLRPDGVPIEVEADGDSLRQPEDAEYAAVVDWREPPAGRWSAQVGWTGILIAVPPGNPVSGLSADDVRGIFTGRIDRWETVNGAPGTIRLTAYGPGSGWADAFAVFVLGGDRLAGEAVLAPSADAMRTAVLEDPRAIGFLAGFENTAGLNILDIDGAAPDVPNLLSGAYPFRVPIFLDADDPPAAEIEQFAGWLQSPGGQAVLMQLNSQE
jgi:phosphate transport system substrate-binding protein